MGRDLPEWRSRSFRLPPLNLHDRLNSTAETLPLGSRKCHMPTTRHFAVTGDHTLRFKLAERHRPGGYLGSQSQGNKELASTITTAVAKADTERRSWTTTRIDRRLQLNQHVVVRPLLSFQLPCRRLRFINGSLSLQQPSIWQTVNVTTACAADLHLNNLRHRRPKPAH